MSEKNVPTFVKSVPVAIYLMFSYYLNRQSTSSPFWTFHISQFRRFFEISVPLCALSLKKLIRSFCFGWLMTPMSSIGAFSFILLLACISTVCRMFQTLQNFVYSWFWHCGNLRTVGRQVRHLEGSTSSTLYLVSRKGKS